MTRTKTTFTSIPTPAPWTAPTTWRLENAHLHLKSLDDGMLHEDASVRALAKSLYTNAVTSLSQMLVASPKVFESAYNPERLFSHSDWLSTAQILYDAARATSAGSNFKFSDNWLNELSKRPAASDGRIFSMCGPDIARALKLTWLMESLTEVAKNESNNPDLESRLAFLLEPSILDDSRCQNLIGLWLSFVAINSEMPVAYKDQILVYMSPAKETLVRPCDILREYFPVALPYWPMLSLLEPPVMDAYSVVVGNQALHDLQDGLPSIPANEDGEWITKHRWPAESAIADIMRMGDADLGDSSQTTAIFVWAMERIAADIVANAGVFEAYHLPGVDSELYGMLTISNSLYHRARAIDAKFAFDPEWMSNLGNRLSEIGETTALLLNMCDERTPLDTRLCWLRSALDTLGLELAKNSNTGRLCDFFDQSSIQNESCQRMVALWLALMAEHPAISIETKISIAHYAVNDRAVGTMTAQNIILHLIPDALPQWAMIKGLGLRLHDAYVAIGGDAALPPVVALPTLD